MENSLVSIIIPVYNRANIIAETLESVINQTYENWECIIVDDGSTDNTVAVLNTYSEKDSRIKVYTRPFVKRKGASSCRNYGFYKSKGSFIQYLDSDDLISENKLEVQVGLLENSSHDVFCTCKWGFLKNDNTKQIISHLSVYNNFSDILFFLESLSTSKGYMPIHNYMFHRDLISNVGVWNEFMAINDDGEFMSRVFVYAKKVIHSDDCHVIYRIQNKDSLSSLNSIEKKSDLILSWKLIEINLNLRFKNQELLFLNFNKKIVFDSLLQNDLDIIVENNKFFRNQINEINLLVKMKLFLLRIKTKYNR